jgi:hypothetical protein
MEFERYVPIVFAVLCFGILLYYSLPAQAAADGGTNASTNASASPPPVAPPKEEVKPPPVCEGNATISCVLGKCDGVRACRNGRWADCYVPSVCVPGSNVSCSENGCAKGYKTCNECGTGYGSCFNTTGQ